jgi:hypothetical protein
MTTTTAHINPYPDIAPPAGAEVEADIWEDAQPQRYRVIYGVSRAIAGRNGRITVAENVLVWSHCIQFQDESIDDGSAMEPPGISIDDGNGEHRTQTVITLNGSQARELAAALLEAADQVDGWVAR